MWRIYTSFFIHGDELGREVVWGGGRLGSGVTKSFWVWFESIMDFVSGFYDNVMDQKDV
jgi:hypothetical protein